MIVRVWRHGWSRSRRLRWVRSSRTVEPLGLAHRISRKQDRLLDRLRDPSAAGAAGFPGTADTFDALISEEYALLVTFRRSGEPVPTPMWFGLRDGCVYVESLADAGKVKRLRQDQRVRVAPCTLRGKPKGPSLRASGGSSGKRGAERRDRARSALRPTPATICEGSGADSGCDPFTSSSHPPGLDHP